jgi:type VI secretion system protein ImpH
MSVNFMGLVGPSGVLPHAYTQLVRESERTGEHALGAFLDIMQHRFIALFYRAWLRLHPAGYAGPGERDPASRHLLQLAGLDEPRAGAAGATGAEGADGARPAYDAERLIPLFALLAPQPRSALGLQTVLASYFDVPVEVEQFVGSWARLRTDDLCRVGEAGAATVLGRGAVVGDEVWDQQARVRVRLGPLPREHFERFLPEGEHHAALRDLCALYGHDQFDFEVQLVLERDDVPAVVLGDADQGEHALGWSTWLRTRPMNRDPDEAVFSL